ncbi:MAG: hypothetical protein PWP31_1295 [Clostridia bacterium]|nr:hypothetical protein [Clostridia bacterium]
MDYQLLLEYGWVFIVLIGLEGILATDNALVMAIMVKYLPEEQRKKALFYGLAGAFALRFGSLFAISYLVGIWQVQAIGATYLIFMTINHLVKKFVYQNDSNDNTESRSGNGSGFWFTVLKVELADIAFAVDSILAAVALAVTLPETTLPQIGGLDGGKFLVVLSGGFLGLVIIRFVATYFVRLLQQKPGLETAAYLIVGWVGIKLAVYTLAHPELGIIHEGFPEMITWKITFWIVLLTIALGGWFLSKEENIIDKNSTNVDSKNVVRF